MDPKKILIIEDDPEERLILNRELKREGYIVYEAVTGEEGLKIFKNDKPDLVILDVVLPGIDGWEVLRRIKKGPLSRKVPVMMLTGKSQDIDKIKGYEIGADYYVTKPYNVNKLIPVIKSLVEK
ncbi:MAG: response regulator [Candidatus Omnitrophica bacterium]|nr:response regulator [Candidatus Omnitrophota bacterium]MCM8801974.1 response regulator [Candidatus Omnitrophota bacterium]